ncbi:hypothetical protein VTI74DRAFT_3501 [Chaetomium olivicolor]
MVVHVTSEIEINRSSAEVRAVWLKSRLVVTPLDQTKPGAELKPGGGLRSDFNGTVMKTVVLENTPSTFRWRGSFHGLLIGHRQSAFEESAKSPGGTTLVQTEDIDGVLYFVFKKKAKQRKIFRESVRRFNLDIKATVESILDSKL